MVMPVKEEGVVGFEDVEEDRNSLIKKKKKKKTSLAKKAGAFQSMGLSFPILKAVQKRGYKVPTPIQRKTIPLVLEGRDVVAMARTGSGKTACFLIPMFERLKVRGGQSGIRALILSPTRELALQTMRFVKEIGRYTGLRHCVVVGGDSMESQFSSLHANPDVVIATPGRFLHICVEMELKLDTLQIIIFDEADRLFEMGFGEQLQEITSRLPENRQTLLFSATLPKVLVEFARAGLSDPVLIRLDVESKLPETLDISFLVCRTEEKPSALLILLKHVLTRRSPCIVFAATKHHVEFIHTLLGLAGIKSTYIYSDLDSSARKINAAKFQTGQVPVLVVTDLAARGIDIPQLDYVINYNFPAKPKLFVHRVGRCARAGRQGWAISLVAKDEICYMLDIHLFLSRPLALVQSGDIGCHSKLLGTLPRHLVEEQTDEIINWETTLSDLVSVKGVSENAYKQYLKCRPGASRESVRRSKELNLSSVGTHFMFSNASRPTSMLTSIIQSKRPRHELIQQDNGKAAIVAGIHSYRPPGTIFEIGQSSRSELYTVMKRKRELHKKNILTHRQKLEEKKKELEAKDYSCQTTLEQSNADDLGRTFRNVMLNRKSFQHHSTAKDQVKESADRDRENFIPYQPSDFHSEEGLAVNNFQRDASAVGLDLSADTETGLRSSKRAHKVWDRKKKKMVGVEDKRKGKIRSESGVWIDASYKSGRYKTWMDKTKTIETIQNSSQHDDDTSTTTQAAPSGLPNTHWRRHNMKLNEKSRTLGLKKPDQIVKERIAKEKKQRKHGRKGKKNKK